ncbi:hypothetical protein K440DRAFT_643947 [Wilcoxina mikolae CBS 423.85]|nr:hypothetical protein K440DRAFT_643947 [Wilcoxina mikolae CBS 423.85]
MLLHTALEMVNAVWDTENKVGIRFVVECLITDVLYRIRQYDTKGGHNSAATGQLSYHAVSASGKPIIINCLCDVGFGYINDEDGVTPGKPLEKQNTFLVVVEAKQERMFESAFPQLLACVATVHHARKYAGKSTTVYGIMSDGLHYAFVEIDSNSIKYSLITDFETVYDFAARMFLCAMREGYTQMMAERVPKETGEDIFLHGDADWFVYDDPNPIENIP